MGKATTSVPSTQRYLNIAQIRNGIIVTKSGLLRRVIHVEPVNFALKSEEDQNVIIGQYQNFLNSLNFTIQIVIHSRRLDVVPYLNTLQDAVNNATNELLRFHALEYIDFVRSLTELTNIMDKQFYIVVGFDPPTLNKTGLMGSIFGRREQSQINFNATDWKKYTQELDQRVNLASSGLSAMGLKTQTLDTQKSIELFYSVYNPEEATAEKLAEASTLQAPVISVDAQDKIDLGKNATPLAPVQNQAHHLNETVASSTLPTSLRVEDQHHPSKES